jgi:methionyl-tRNA formyltransferase
MRTAQSPVKRLALERGLALEQPASLREETALAPIAAARPDALVVAAYGLILPETALGIAPHGALNIHASLLPRWRGAAPIQRALLAGDRQTGISIMKMDAGLDTGPVLCRQAIEIRDDDDAQSLHDRLATLGAGLIVRALAEVETGRAGAEPQPAQGITYARKIGRDDAALDWSAPSEQLERQVRALRPSPGAQTALRGEPLKIWRARPATGEGPPGTILHADALGVAVACGKGALLVEEMQRAGGRRLASAEFLRGCALAPGERLGAAG